VKVIVYVFGVETLATRRAAGLARAVAGFTIVVASIYALAADNPQAAAWPTRP